MSKYTISIKEILQQTAGNDNPWEPDEMYNIALSALFGNEINVISEEYRKHFVTSFAYHYFLEEIGLETFGLWKMELIGTIYENSAYINHVYDLIGKDIFSQYSVKHKIGKATDNGNHSKTGKDISDRTIKTDGSSSAKSESDSTENRTTTNDLTNKTEYDSQQRNTGTTTNQSNGQITDAHTGYDEEIETGTRSNTHLGSDSVRGTGTISTTHSGQDTTRDENSNIKNYINEVTIRSDTPMGDLENMIRSPHVTAAGTGVDYATASGVEYNYMSDASEHDYTNVQEFNTTQIVERGTADLQENNTTDTTTYNSSQQQTDDHSNKTVYNSDTTQQRNITDTQTDNTLSAHTGMDTEKSTGTQQVVVSEEAHGASGEEHTDTTNDNLTKDISESGTKSNDHTDSEDVEDYTVTYDMIMRMEPMMRKIWNLFDSLFIKLL